MKELIKDKLYSFDEKVRVEIGPQIVELDCTDENLSNDVTHPNYHMGGRDAHGRIIRYTELSDEVKAVTDASMGIVNKDEKMLCVDWKAKHAPYLWKIYEYQKTDEKAKKLNKKGKAEVDKKGQPIYEPIYRFIKVNEVEGKEEALALAKSIFEGA